MSQKDKTKFRQSAKWKKFKAYLKKTRKVDCVTLSPLRKGHNLHHLDLNEEHYSDISDETHFEPLNKKTHEMVHFLYGYYVKDEKVIERLKNLLDRMVKKMKGKNYANRKPENERPLNDFYPTPSCMVKELVKSGFFPGDKNIKIFDPCCGKGAICNVLRNYGYKNFVEEDLIYGQDFLKKEIPERPIYDVLIMNPPFKLFDEFVYQAQYFADKIYVVGKLNFFGAHNRNVNCLWKHLMWVLPFDRQIAFDRPETEDGKVECGMMVTGWFIWNKNYEGLPKIKVLDMQKHILRKGKTK